MAAVLCKVQFTLGRTAKPNEPSQSQHSRFANKPTFIPAPTLTYACWTRVLECMAVPGRNFSRSSHFWSARARGHLEAAKQPLNIPPRRPGCKPTSRTTMIYIQQYVQTYANTSAHAYARMYVHSHTQHICNTHMRTPRVTHYVHMQCAHAHCPW